MREATRRGSTLDVVTAWTSVLRGDAPGRNESREGARALAQQVQDLAVAAVLNGFGVSPVLSRQVVEGDAGDVLLQMARTADYLVVGTGRSGRPKRRLLGSVSDYCVRHARCPVLVVQGARATGLATT